MTQQITQQITDLPTPPNRTDSATFNVRADAFMDSLDDLASEINAWAPQANAVAVEVSTTAAEVSSDAASVASNKAAVDLIAQSEGAIEYNSETSYALYDMAIGSDGHTYRRLSAGSGVDPVDNPGTWIQLTGNYSLLKHTTDLIGVAGAADFGAGICDPATLPPGMVGLAGYDIQGHDNYGNYQYSDGSIMVYVPKFYYIVGTGSNGFAVNVIDVKGIETFDDTSTANTAGYALHRSFIDGGSEHNGFFVDKYMASKNAFGGGYVASSIKNGLPLSAHADHNPIADLTACVSNFYYETITSAHSRDGVDGAVNADSIFFCSSRFIYSALAMLSMAHGQAASSTTNCAWYSAGTTNYPKGCNDNALGDTDDGTIAYVSDGYSNCGKTGSGTPFSKTTHNGQNCGVADLNGLMWEISIGATCIASTLEIEAMTRANPCNVQETTHGKSTGDYVQITSITQADWTALNSKIFAVTVIDGDNFTLDGVDSSGFAGDYVPGTDPGQITLGDFYVTKEATSMADFTSGNTGVTDHWGVTGVAAMMDGFNTSFETTYPNNGYAQKFGDGANQVLGEATSGNEYVLSGLGVPKDTDGISAAGTNLFGLDYYHQYIRNELFLLAGVTWNVASDAGVWGVSWGSFRTASLSTVGFRSACYPV